jgi:hypothetical protein
MKTKPISPSQLQDSRFQGSFEKKLAAYKESIDKLRKHATEEVSQRGRYLFRMLEWFVVDQVLYGVSSDPLFVPTPSINVAALIPIFEDSSRSEIRQGINNVKILVKQGHLLNPTTTLDGNNLYIDLITVTSTITSVLCYRSVPSRGPGTEPSENHIKAEMFTKILKDAFSLGAHEFHTNWEYHYQIPGHAGSGSARSDFAAVVLNDIDQQFCFLIVEFEAKGYAVHKDETVVVAEAAFEFNRILGSFPYLSENEVNEIRLHIGLAMGTTIRMCSISAVFDQEKQSLIYVRNSNNFTFELHTENPSTNILNALNLISYLRKNVCEDGKKLKELLKKEKRIINEALLNALPSLPKVAATPRTFRTAITPPSHRII